MKLITRNTDYAIRALCFIAGGEKRINSVSELVKGLKIPRPFLRKILQVLNKEGLLVSYKGKGGGFVLAVKPEKISIVDLIEIFQGALKINECLFRRSLCPNVRTCVLKKKIDDIEKYVVSKLRPITIASISGKAG